jgi:putative pyruvate formate lyase activating enzyme
VKKDLGIPIVCNTGGYDSDFVLECFEGLVDVYLPDYKYAVGECAARLSKAADYPEVAIKAIRKMQDQVGDPEFTEDGIIKKGVIVRHLCLPGERKNSIQAIRTLGETFKSNEIRLSIMRQYTPIEGMTGSLSRKLTTFEYESVLKEAEKYGFEGYLQSAEAADKCFIPPFDLTGIDE